MLFSGERGLLFRDLERPYFSKIRLRSDYPDTRGLQVDVSVTTVMTILGQLIGSLSIGRLLELFGPRVICIYMTSLSTIGFLYSLLVVDYGQTKEIQSMDRRDDDTFSVLLSNE